LFKTSRENGKGVKKRNKEEKRGCGVYCEKIGWGVTYNAKKPKERGVAHVWGGGIV